MAETSNSRSVSRRAVPLRQYLGALVLVPLVGVGVLTALVAGARSAEAASAARAEEAVRTLAQLDAARRAVDQEMLPTLSLVVIDDPATSAALNVSGFLVTAQRPLAVQELADARQAVDRALAGVSGGAGTAAAARARTALQALREDADARAVPLEEAYLGYLQTSNELMNAERAVAAQAGSEGVPGATLRAIRDVQTIGQLAQIANRQLPLYLGALLIGDDTGIGSQLAWQTAWLAYTDARQQMDSLSQPSLRAAWRTLQRSPTTTELDAVLGATGTGEARLRADVTRMVSLVYLSVERDTELAALVDAAVEQALSLAAADRAHAEEDLRTTLALGLGLLAVSAAGAWWLGRTVTRSLRLLAGQATRISHGELVEVEARGPREVRTVSAALGDAVAGLRRIQDQAQAVARGDLDDALLDAPLPGPLGEVVHASVRQIVDSVRQREELQFALAHRATHDPLTELPNRAQALTLVTSALHRARRSGDMTGLLFVDLDGFKAVNDGHGHAAGDTVLREVAARMRSLVRPGDVVCRLGGDEFVVLVEPVRSEHDLMDLAQRLVTGVGEPVDLGGTRVRVGASIGVAVSRDGGVDADVLFVEADTAAYRAKQHGRGRAEIFDETLRRQLAERAQTEAAITAAL